MMSLGLRTVKRMPPPKIPPVIQIAVKGGKPTGPVIVYNPVPSGVDGGGGYGKNLNAKMSFPQGNLMTYTGNSLWEWWYGKPPLPPIVLVTIIEEPGEPDIDTSGCRLLLANAIRKVAQKLIEAAQARVEKSRSKDPDEPPPEPEGVTLKTATDDSKAALADYAACLKKGLSQNQAIRDALYDEGKSMVEGLVKAQFKSKGAIAAFDKKAVELEKEYAKDINTEYNKYKADLFVLVDAVGKFNKDLTDSFNEMIKQHENVKKMFGGFTKAYMDIVKSSDGLTSVRPGVVKALERVRDALDEAGIETAKKELKTQKDAVIKSAGLANPKAKKFITKLDELEKEWL